MVKRILLALGGTPFSQVAVRRGVELAKSNGASLVAVTILDTEYWKQTLGSWMTASQASRLIDARPWAAVEQRVEEIVAQFRQICREADVPCEVKKPEQRPFETLAAEWRYCDLVVFGLRGLFDYNLVPEPERAIAQLVRRGVRPILAVASEYRPIRRVLIAYSGSMESAKAMKQFVQLRLWPDAELQLVCFGQEHEEAQQLLRDATIYCQAHGLAPATKVTHDSAREALLPHAQASGADLIVLGDSFRHVLLQDLLGDTISHVIQGADRPLFLSH